MGDWAQGTQALPSNQAPVARKEEGRRGGQSEERVSMCSKERRFHMN